MDPATLQQAIAELPPEVRDAIRSGKSPAQCAGPNCPPVDPQFAATIGAMLQVRPLYRRAITQFSFQWL